MTNALAKAQEPKRSLIMEMAGRYNLEPAIFQSTIKETCFPKKTAVSNEQFAAFLMVAKEYSLNPLTREIYAFPQNGGIVPIVSIDGWMNLINSHPQMDGINLEELREGSKVFAVKCTIYRKDRTHPIVVTEYMDECVRPTEPWKKWPIRMLRHKAAIQCARVAFGFAGIYEPDEGERIKDVTPVSATINEVVSREIQEASGVLQESTEELEPEYHEYEDLAEPAASVWSVFMAGAKSETLESLDDAGARILYLFKNTVGSAQETMLRLNQDLIGQLIAHSPEDYHEVYQALNDINQ